MAGAPCRSDLIIPFFRFINHPVPKLVLTLRGVPGWENQNTDLASDNETYR